MRHTKGVEGYCTCGAKPPADARFCHRCARPMGDFTGIEEPEEPIISVTPIDVPPIPVIAVPLEISFSNGTAVRIGFGVACITWFVLSLLAQLSPLFVFIVPLVAGFLAVRFYCQRTKETLSVLSGARMGWITGVFCFVISLVTFTLVMVAIQSQGGWDAVIKQITTQGQASPREIEQLTKILQSPSGLVEMITIGLVSFFLLTSLLPTLGGALSARLSRRP